MKRIIILFLLFLPVFGFSNRITVCLTCPISTIQQAIDTAKEGDEIFIKKGIYKEYDIVIDKSLSIIGENYPIIDGESKGEIITIIANYVSITGIQVQNVGTSYIKDQAGIRVKKSKHFKLQSNRLRNTFFGIYLEHARDGEVINNEVIGEAIAEMSSGNGIHAWYCKNIKIEDNWVTNHRDGIYFEFVDSSYICCNNSKDNLRYGLHFMFSNDDEYTKNTFNDNGAGVAVMFSRRINMFENKFIKNWGASSYGLLLKEIYDAEISNNIFQENTIGIYIEGSTRIDYHHNNFIQNGWALKMAGGSLDNTIHKNNFIGNTFELAVFSKTNNNTFDGNYWSEYTGYDINRDQVGDVPYRPVKLFSHVVNQTPESIVLLRSPFVDLMNFSEKVSPVFTPKNVMDNTPAMKKIARVENK